MLVCLITPNPPKANFVYFFCKWLLAALRICLTSLYSQRISKSACQCLYSSFLFVYHIYLFAALPQQGMIKYGVDILHSIASNVTGDTGQHRENHCTI